MSKTITYAHGEKCKVLKLWSIFYVEKRGDREGNFRQGCQGNWTVSVLVEGQKKHSLMTEDTSVQRWTDISGIGNELDPALVDRFLLIWKGFWFW